MEPTDTGSAPQSPPIPVMSTGGVESEHLASTEISLQLANGNAEPRQQYAESDVRNVSIAESNHCVICLDDLAQENESELFPCRHKEFHFECIDHWAYLQPDKKTCPLCKTVVTGIRWIKDGKPNISFFVSPKPSALVDFNTGDIFHEPTRLEASQRDGPRPRPRRLRPPHLWPFRGRSREPSVDADGPDVELNFRIRQRREVYRHNTYSLHVGSNRTTGYRELTPAMFRADEGLVSRARMFIRRELRVFSFLVLPNTVTMTSALEDWEPQNCLARRRGINAEYLLNYTIAILKEIDMMGSTGQAEEMMADFLGKKYAKLFLHELRSWLRSPYPTLALWDSRVQYPQHTGSAARRSSAEQLASPLRGTEDSSSIIRQGQPSGDREQSEPSNSADRKPSSRGDFYRPNKSGRIARNRPWRRAAMRGFHRKPLDDQSREFWGLRRERDGGSEEP